MGEDTPKAAPKRDKLDNLAPAWKPGQSGNPAGRPKGARTKLGEDFVQALLDDFTDGGADAIRLMRAEKPELYSKMIAGLLTKEVDVQGNVTVGEFLDSLNT